jgi:hypothetical protein
VERGDPPHDRDHLRLDTRALDIPLARPRSTKAAQELSVRRDVASTDCGLGWRRTEKALRREVAERQRAEQLRNPSFIKFGVLHFFFT